MLAQIHYKISRGQPESQEFWVKMAKMTLKVKVNGTDFQYQVYLVQIRFQLKSVTSLGWWHHWMKIMLH